MPLIMKKTINGQPVKIRLTADTGSGNPVGTILPLYKKSNPIGYLYCDGSTFDETVYPALYAYLGTNVLPDYREFALVGAEQNTTDVYDASTNPNGTIHDHDVYTEGQAKDDQVQDHRHSAYFQGGYDKMASNSGGEYVVPPNDANTGGVVGARAGTVTRGKRKAVYFYIKATSGVMEDNTENFINVINAERSYSTSEVNTGKKWIDGKPIYRKVIDFGSLPDTTSKTVAHNIQNLETFTFVHGIVYSSGGCVPIPYLNPASSEYTITLDITNENVVISTAMNRSGNTAKIILEYTKTT